MDNSIIVFALTMGHPELDKERLATAVEKANREFPDYFLQDPGSEIDNLRSKIFLYRVKINYYEGYVNHAKIDQLKRSMHDSRVKLSELEKA